MAIKFGKREKIIVGVIIGVGTIFGVHAGVFQSRAREREQINQDFAALKATVETLPQRRDEEKIDQIRADTDKDLDVLWKTILRMNIVLPSYIMPPPEPPLPADPTNEEQMLVYSAAKQEWQQKGLRTHQRVNAAVMAEHIDRLIEMRKAYEAGRAWRGDTLGFGEDKSKGKTMRLSFLGAERVWLPFLEPEANVSSAPGAPPQTGPGAEARGWDIPVDLPQYPLNLREKAVLKDAIQRLYDSWNVLTYLSPDSADYEMKRQAYLYQLQSMGLNVERLMKSEADLGPAIPWVVKLAWAHMIWKQRAENEIIRVGTVELTYDMLKSMFAFELPEWLVVLPFIRGADALERIIPIARKSGVDDIVRVKLPGGLGQMHQIPSYLDTDIANAKKAGAPAATPRSGVGGLITSIRTRPVTANTGATSGMATLPPLPPLLQQPVEKPKLAILIKMIYVASNQASVRFLYNLVNDGQGFGIEALNIYAGEGDKVWVDATISANLWFTDITPVEPDAPARLTDAATGEPLSEVGKRLVAEHRKQRAKLGLDMDAVVQRTIAESNATTETMTFAGPSTDTLQSSAAASTGTLAASTDTLAAGATTTQTATVESTPAQ